MLRRRSRHTEPVNVNARFARMSSEDLESVSEHSLMNGGAALDRFRHSRSAIDLDEAMVNADQAHQAMAALMVRMFPKDSDS